MLSNIRIVLVETSHPGNIGAVARAMKNMQLSRLYLVAPKIFPCADASSRASGADDVLEAATVCPTLAEAISDCQLVFGTSARLRTIAWPQQSPRECAQLLMQEAQQNQVAIVFGRENSGLTNKELDLCQYLLHIPSNPAFSSLNLAAAVQIISYELLVASAEETLPQQQPEAPLATAEQMASFYQHLLQTLIEIDFMHPDKSRSVMRRLRRIYNRSLLDTKELDILRGILTMTSGARKK